MMDSVYDFTAAPKEETRISFLKMWLSIKTETPIGICCSEDGASLFGSLQAHWVELHSSKCRQLLNIYDHMIDRSNASIGVQEPRRHHRSNFYVLEEFFASWGTIKARHKITLPTVYYFKDGDKLLADEPDAVLASLVSNIHEIAAQDGRELTGYSFKILIPINSPHFKSRLKPNLFIPVTKKTFASRDNQQ